MQRLRLREFVIGDSELKVKQRGNFRVSFFVSKSLLAMVTDLPLPTNESASDPEKLKVEEDDEELRDYFDKLMETDGFYDGKRPKGLSYGGVISALPEHLEDVNECIDFVIKEHNEKPEWGMKLQFSEIVRANCSACAGANYYITFKAADLKTFSQKEKEYEARVYKCWDGKKRTGIFRQKAPSKRVFVKPDHKERHW
ncbi:hypothetical protein LINPERHAP1_LOCUS9585 [Linum perenne]